MKLPFFRRSKPVTAFSPIWHEASRPAAATTVLLIHGIGSTADKTWIPLVQILLSDPDLVDFSFIKYEYPTSKFEFKPWVRVPSLDELALGLATEIKIRVGTANVIVVAHSMGGLIARQLTTYQIKNHQPLSIRRALLLATPNSGASLAALAKDIFPRHAQTRFLAPFSPEINQLNEDWLRFDIDKRVRFDFVAGGIDHIVEMNSAKGTPGRLLDDLLVENNHGNITHPSDENSSNYKLIKRFITGEETGPLLGKAVSTGDPLFAVYRIHHEDFYLHRGVDRQLAQTVEVGHCWITGGSGLGKTASATRRALVGGATLFQVYLGSYQGMSTDRILHAVHNELLDRVGTGTAISDNLTVAETISGIRALLRNHPPHKRACLLIEEIPLPQEKDFLEFSNLLEMLFESLNAGGIDNVDIVITSIPDFSTEIIRSSEKLAASLRFLNIGKWTDSEISCLIRIISEALPVTLSDTDIVALVTASNGRPRFVKEAFQRLKSSQAPAETMSTIVRTLLVDNRA